MSLASGLRAQVRANLFALKYEEIPHGNIFIVGLFYFLLLILLFGFEWLLFASFFVWGKEDTFTVQNLQSTRKVLALALNYLYQ